MQNGAKLRGLVWQLPLDLVHELLQKNCNYCGAPPGNYVTNFNHTRGVPDCNGNYRYSGLDRVDNALGYLPDNVVPCCKICNIAKRTMSVDEFLTWVAAVYTHSVAPSR